MVASTHTLFIFFRNVFNHYKIYDCKGKPCLKIKPPIYLRNRIVSIFQGIPLPSISKNGVVDRKQQIIDGFISNWEAITNILHSLNCSTNSLLNLYKVLFNGCFPLSLFQIYPKYVADGKQQIDGFDHSWVKDNWWDEAKSTRLEASQNTLFVTFYKEPLYDTKNIQ
jgi:hypothetical protein